MKRKPDLFEIVLGVLFLGGLAYFFLAGGKPSGAGVAVLDLERVAADTSRGVTITEAMQAQKATLESQLNSLRVSLQEGLAAKKNEFGETPTQEQQKVLQNLQKEIITKVTQSERQSQQELLRHQQQLLSDFRDELRPIAAEIARDRGAAVVLIANLTVVLSVDTTVDITKEVIAKLQPIPSTSIP